MGRRRHLTRPSIDAKTHHSLGYRRKLRDETPVQDRDRDGYDELYSLGVTFQEPDYAANLFDDDPDESERPYPIEPEDYDDVMGVETSSHEESEERAASAPDSYINRVPGSKPGEMGPISEFSAEKLQQDSVAPLTYATLDEHIRDVLRREFADWEEENDEVDIGVALGQVVLQGVVHNQEAKQVLGKMALETDGVKDVINMLTVRTEERR